MVAALHIAQSATRIASFQDISFHPQTHHLTTNVMRQQIPRGARFTFADQALSEPDTNSAPLACISSRGSSTDRQSMDARHTRLASDFFVSSHFLSRVLYQYRHITSWGWRQAIDVLTRQVEDMMVLHSILLYVLYANAQLHCFICIIHKHGNRDMKVSIAKTTFVLTRSHTSFPQNMTTLCAFLLQAQLPHHKHTQNPSTGIQWPIDSAE